MDEQMKKRTPTKTLKTKSASKREKYIDKLSQQLREWDRELVELEEKGGHRIGKLRKNMHRKLEQLRTKRNELQEQLERIEEVSESSYKSMKADTEKLWKDIKKAFKNIRKVARS